MTEYIDMTPTWSALLPVMLEVTANGNTTFADQFVKMARAADKWNDAVKRGLLATDYELDRRDEDNDPIDAEDSWLDNSDLDEEDYRV